MLMGSRTLVFSLLHKTAVETHKNDGIILPYVEFNYRLSATTSSAMLLYAGGLPRVPDELDAY